jgi:hypothetical protein
MPGATAGTPAVLPPPTRSSTPPAPPSGRPATPPAAPPRSHGGRTDCSPLLCEPPPGTREIPNFVQTFRPPERLYSHGPSPPSNPAALLRRMVHALPRWCSLHHGGNTAQGHAISRLTNRAQPRHGATGASAAALGSSLHACVPRSLGAFAFFASTLHSHDACPSPMVQPAPWGQHLQPILRQTLAPGHRRPMVQLAHNDTHRTAGPASAASSLLALVPRTFRPLRRLVASSLPRMVQPCTMWEAPAKNCQQTTYAKTPAPNGATCAPPQTLAPPPDRFRQSKIRSRNSKIPPWAAPESLWQVARGVS